MHWIIWQTARKRRLRSLERARQQALEELDVAEAAYVQACKMLSVYNQIPHRRIAFMTINRTRQAVRLAGQRALEALDDMEAAQRER